MDEAPFWKTKPLDAMTPAEWESLCDGCGKCCLIKLEDEDTGELHFTDVACYLLDRNSCRCSQYQERSVLVPDCVTLSPENIAALHFMPSTCAYRLVAAGEDLPLWHPLVSGRAKSVHTAGMSVRRRCISEDDIDEEDLPHRLVDWPR